MSTVEWLSDHHCDSAVRCPRFKYWLCSLPACATLYVPWFPQPQARALRGGPAKGVVEIHEIICVTDNMCIVFGHIQ